MSISVQSLVQAMESIAPVSLAESWDNVGLLLGAPSDPLSGPVLLTIDLTEPVLDEARSMKAGAIVAYHPPIFDPIRRLTGEQWRGRVLLGAARAGMAVYCPHTALDNAPGALGDWLADAVLEPGKPRGADRRALRPAGLQRPTEELKIVTFAPPEKADTLRKALASAGAGIIGRYEVCSFAAPGTGTFLGQSGARPAVGQAGRLESAHEVRLEMVCSRAALSLALATLRQFHPYEEPAIDVYELLPRPERSTGAGRRLVLDHPVPIAALVARLKAALGVPYVQVAAAGREAVSCIGVCPGSGGGLWIDAQRDGCELFVTGEMKHHDVLAAAGAGLSIICAGHTATERPYLPVLADRLARAMPGVSVQVSRADRDPVVVG